MTLKKPPEAQLYIGLLVGLVIVFLSQRYIIPTARDIGATREKLPLVVEQGTDVLVISEPFSGAESLSLYKSRENDFVALEFSEARFSEATLKWLEVRRPPGEYRKISYTKAPVEAGLHDQEIECKTKISLSLAAISNPVSSLYLFPASHAKDRSLNLRPEGGDLLVTLSQGPGCIYSLWAFVLGKSPSGDEGDWTTDIATPFPNEIIVKEGARLTFTFLRPAASSPDWKIKLLQVGGGQVKRIEVRADGGDGQPSQESRLLARAYAGALTLNKLTLGSKGLQMTLYGLATVEDSDLGGDSTHLEYLRRHRVLAVFVLGFNLVLILAFGALCARILERFIRIKTGVDFVIVTALEEEQKAVLRQLPEYVQVPPSEDDVRVYFAADLPVRFSDGSEGTYKVVSLSLLNMGRVEAANATSDAIRRWRPRYLLLVGIAGGFPDQEVELGDVLISDQIVDYELQKLVAEGPKSRDSVHRADSRLLNFAKNYRDRDWLGRISADRPSRGQGSPRRHIGPIATGDKVVAFRETALKLLEHWPKLIGVEMEAGGAASACFQASRPPGFFMVRAVSDTADEEKDSENVKRWRTYACEVAAAYAVALLQSGPVTTDGKRGAPA